jgi:SAM-dependent methyltransferase
MSHPYTRGYFENREGSHYSGYEDWPQFKQRAEWIKRTYFPNANSKLTGSSPSVYEVGCAKGFLVEHLIGEGLNASGCDISEYAISKARFPELLGVFDITKTRADYSEHDLVVSFDTLEHIREEDLPFVLSGFKTAEQQFHMITTSEYDFGGDDTHYTSKPKQWWVNQFEEAGIKNYRIIHAGEQALFDES